MRNHAITTAQLSDIDILADIFLKQISKDPEYISHGELQMGVGTISYEDGKAVKSISENAKKVWLDYIREKITSDDSEVFKLSINGKIEGFAVVDTESDGGEPFGMLCDIIVCDDFRNSGFGEKLFNHAMNWFKERGFKDVYLESGLGNHSAHHFFERRGFNKVSSIFHCSLY